MTAPSPQALHHAPLDNELADMTVPLGSLLGRVDGVGSATVRVIVEGEDLRWEVNAPGGSFALERLEPGNYRVEMRSDRLVIARRIDIGPGHNAITLTVHANVAQRIGLDAASSNLAAVIRLPV
jgi:hypothetical protein